MRILKAPSLLAKLPNASRVGRQWKHKVRFFAGMLVSMSGALILVADVFRTATRFL